MNKKMVTINLNEARLGLSFNEEVESEFEDSPFFKAFERKEKKKRRRLTDAELDELIRADEELYG